MHGRIFKNNLETPLPFREKMPDRVIRRTNDKKKKGKLLCG